MKVGLSVVLTYGGAAFKKLVRLQLHHMRFSDITKDVVVAASACYDSFAACYFWEPRLPLIFKPTGNGKYFSILENLKSDEVKVAAFQRHGVSPLLWCL